MIAPVAAASSGGVSQAIVSAILFVGTAAAVWAGYAPVAELIRRQERQFDVVLRGKLLLDITPRAATLLSLAGVAVLAVLGWAALGGFAGVIVGAACGMFLPVAAMSVLQKRRLRKLEDQLVGGIQILASGVRAGLNLVQAFELVARDGPVPLGQEFAHLLREYEYGVPLEEAMDNAAGRIGSGDFRLLFSALQTHRERGGDLGQTLDRIAESIREIQRLENRVQALTAQGRATARWLGAMPVVVLAILYLLVPESVRLLFTDDLGKLILLLIVALNVVGFLWIRRIVAVDI